MTLNKWIFAIKIWPSRKKHHHQNDCIHKHELCKIILFNAIFQKLSTFYCWQPLIFFQIYIEKLLSFISLISLKLHTHLCYKEKWLYIVIVKHKILKIKKLFYKWLIIVYKQFWWSVLTLFSILASQFQMDF